MAKGTSAIKKKKKKSPESFGLFMSYDIDTDGK